MALSLTISYGESILDAGTPLVDEGVRSDGTVQDIIVLTAAEYAALTPVSTTVYLIVG